MNDQRAFIKIQRCIDRDRHFLETAKLFVTEPFPKAACTTSCGNSYKRPVPSPHAPCHMLVRLLPLHWHSHICRAKQVRMILQGMAEARNAQENVSLALTVLRRHQDGASFDRLVE